LVLPLNDSTKLRETLIQYREELACVIIEPIPANNGLLLQDKTFLTHLREWCTELGILLIFDEVISGFRVAFGGAAEEYGIIPDIVTYGKIIGGGLPVGAYGSTNEIMSFVSPDGPVYQAGTLSGNPVAMSAGIAQLTACNQTGFYKDQEARTKTMVDAINSHATSKGYNFEIVQIGSIFWLSFDGKKRIQDADAINPDMTKFNQLHAALLNRGVYLGPSGYEVGFVSAAHSTEILAEATHLFCSALDEIYS
jgi:glutamate-1-semialdehyde 2,1-aminomutase